MALIQGTNSSDFIDNPASNDTVYLGGGNDRFDIGNGVDTVSGGDGDDNLNSVDSSFRSALRGASVFGESGNDRIDATFLLEESKLYGGEGEDTIIGGEDSDALFGGSDDDVLDGWFSNDRLYGEEGDDVLLGGLGRDTLVGGNGDDFLSALIGGKHEGDVLYGGGGADLFIVSTGDIIPTSNSSENVVNIEDFNSTEDSLRLTGSASDYTLTTSGVDTLIFAEGDSSGNPLAVINGSGLDLNSDAVFT